MNVCSTLFVWHSVQYIRMWAIHDSLVFALNVLHVGVTACVLHHVPCMEMRYEL